MSADDDNMGTILKDTELFDEYLPLPLDKEEPNTQQEDVEVVREGGEKSAAKYEEQLFGGRRRKRLMSVNGWSKMAPDVHERTLMMKRCGKKCFFGPKKSFPICNKHTCKVNSNGVQAAYMRAREYMTIRRKNKSKLMTYKKIMQKALRRKRITNKKRT